MTDKVINFRDLCRKTLLFKTFANTNGTKMVPTRSPDFAPFNMLKTGMHVAPTVKTEVKTDAT